jgi:hypothetical protein
MASKKKTLLYAILGILVVGFVVVAVQFAGEYFKGQLALNKEGVDLFPASPDKSGKPVISLCLENEKCSKKITVRFLLENGKFVNQLSLENAVIKNESGKILPLTLIEDNGKNVKILRKGDKKELSIKTGPLSVGEKDALYIKEATGISFIVPDTGKFDLFNNGYFFNSPTGAEEIRDIKVITFEVKSADGKSRIFTAVPDFYSDCIGGIEFAQFNVNLADAVSDKIAKRLSTDKTPFYLIITSVYIAPDFLRTPSYTASGMAYSLSGGMAPKYGLHLEKIYQNCAKAGKDCTNFKCWDDKTTKDALNFTLSHELTHIYQIEKGTKDKVKGDLTYLEGLAELNALSLDGIDWVKINNKYKTTNNCKSAGDVYKSGMCMIQYFKNEITEANLKNFFFLKKGYDFSKNMCGSWWDAMKEITGKDLANLKSDFDSKICK